MGRSASVTVSLFVAASTCWAAGRYSDEPPGLSKVSLGERIMPRIKRCLVCAWLVWSFVAPFSNVTPSYGQPPSATVAPAVDSEPDNDGEESDDAVRRSAVRHSVLNKGRKEAGFTEEEKARIKDNCLFGMPKIDTAAGLGPVNYVVRKGYVLAHSSVDKIPFWVAEHSTKDEVIGNLPRKDAFAPDPLLLGKPRAELSDYTNSGFDRGHMAPAGDQTVDRQLKDETFYLSNMVPQIGKTFNQGIWRELEERVRKWTVARGETWIITGGMFYDPLEETPETADGLIPYDTIGENEVGVPTHTYKIVVAKTPERKWESIAFVMANKKYNKPYRLHLYITTIDWIEERTGINFMPDILSETGDAGLEDRLERTRSPMWSE